jgi:hypothetical protein
MSLKPSVLSQNWSELCADVDTSVVASLADNPPDAMKEACEILLRLIGNVLRDPSNLKFRSIRLSNPVPILPKVTNIGLQIFVTRTFYIFVTFYQYILVEQFFTNFLSQFFKEYLQNGLNKAYKYLKKICRIQFSQICKKFY